MRLLIMKNFTKITTIIFCVFLNSLSVASTWISAVEEPIEISSEPIVISNGNLETIISGRYANLTNKSINKNEKLCTEINNTNNIYSLKSAKNELVLAGITTLQINNEIIYVISRHAFLNSGMNEEDFKLAFPELKIFEVADSDEVLDVLFISNNKQNVTNLIEENSENQKYNRSWVFWHFGSMGNGDLIRGCSTGNSFKTEYDENNQKTGYFGLPNTTTNFSSSGSSGAVVWGYSAKLNQIQPYGVITCLELSPHDSNDENKIVRVLGFEKIKHSRINPITFNQAIDSRVNLKKFDSCIPVDRETIGADAIDTGHN